MRKGKLKERVEAAFSRLSKEWDSHFRSRKNGGWPLDASLYVAEVVNAATDGANEHAWHLLLTKYDIEVNDNPRVVFRPKKKKARGKKAARGRL